MAMILHNSSILKEIYPLTIIKIIKSYFSLKKKRITKENNKSSIKDIYKFIKPYYKTKEAKNIIIRTIILTMLSKGLNTSSPIFLKEGINSLLEKERKKKYKEIMPNFIYAYTSKILSGYLNELKNYEFSKLNTKIYIKYSNEIMDNINNIPYNKFKENSYTIINSIDKCGSKLYTINRVIFPQLISIFFEFGFLCFSINKYFGKKYLITNILTYYLYVSFSKKMGKIRKQFFNERLKAIINSENKFNDIINNIINVKYFQKEEFEKKNYINLIKDTFKYEKKIVKSLSFLNNGQNTINNFCILTNMLIGLNDYFKNKISIGDFFMLQGLFSQMLIPLNIIGFLIKEIDETKAEFKAGILLRERQKNIKDNFNKPNLKINKGIIKFENVLFGYNNKPILNNLSLIFEPNKINCIVGESGVGKTTLFNLIYLLIKPNKGRILIDNQDITKYSLKSLRNILSISSQNNLLNESLLYNLLYGIKEKNYNKNYKSNILKMNDILIKLKMYNKINNLPYKFNTKVGQNGSKLSEGEKQRILFTRALMKDDYKILLLDEPTSFLDRENTTNIFKLIKKEKLNKNIIIITHKLGLAKYCDKIFVMKDGKIKEEGTYEQLMNKKGEYFNMYIKQINKNIKY